MVSWYFFPLQACATYGKRMPTSLSAICSFWTEKLPFSVKKKKRPDTILLLQMYAWFLAKAWPVSGYLSLTCSSSIHTLPLERSPGNALCPIDRMKTSRDRLLIGIEWDCSVVAALGLCKCQSPDLAESLKREGFLVPTIVLLSRGSGKQVGAQLRYSQER